MKNKNIIMIIASILIIIAIIAIIVSGKNKKTASTNQTNSNTNKSTTEQVKKTSETIKLTADDNGDVVVDTTNIGNTATFYNYDYNGTTIKLFAVKASDGTIRMAFNTCQVCNPSPMAYFKQSGKNFICQNCKNSFATDSIGKERGGCNPIPITTDERIDEENTITIKKDFIESHAENFES